VQRQNRFALQERTETCDDAVPSSATRQAFQGVHPRAHARGHDLRVQRGPFTATDLTQTLEQASIRINMDGRGASLGQHRCPALRARREVREYLPGGRFACDVAGLDDRMECLLSLLQHGAVAPELGPSHARQCLYGRNLIEMP
jgi:hypothetical protein